MSGMVVAGVIIKEVAESKDLKEFVNLPFKLYRADEPWVPPLKGDFIKYIKGENNYLNQAGPNTKIIALKDGEVIGRLLVGINEELNRAKGFKEGYIALFECIEDYEVAHSMLEFAESWLKDKGINLIKGPLSLPGGDDCRGFIIDNFKDDTLVMNVYNKQYYNDFFIKYGFIKYFDCYAYKSHIENNDIARYEKLVPYAMSKYSFNINKIDLKNIDKELADIKYVIEKAMPKDWDDFIPPNDEELELIKKQLVPLADPDLIYIARSNNGEPIGFNISMPDYNQVLKEMKGKLLPFGIIKYLYYKRKINRIRFFVLFVIPEYRNKGVSSAIYLNSYLAALKKGYNFIEGSTIWEYNDSMMIDIEKCGGIKYKTYRIYKKEI